MFSIENQCFGTEQPIKIRHVREAYAESVQRLLTDKDNV